MKSFLKSLSLLMTAALFIGLLSFGAVRTVSATEPTTDALVDVEAGRYRQIKLVVQQ